MGPDPNSSVAGSRRGNFGEHWARRGELPNIEEIGGVFAGERLEFREGQVHRVRKKRTEAEQQVLTALGVLEEVISGQRHQGLGENQEVGQITVVEVSKN